MKVSVSLPEEDIAFLDAYAKLHGAGSRSAVVHSAVQLLRTAGLSAAYEEAWDEWSSTGEDVAWDATVVDGLSA